MSCERLEVSRPSALGSRASGAALQPSPRSEPSHTAAGACRELARQGVPLPPPPRARGCPAPRGPPLSPASLLFAEKLPSAQETPARRFGDGDDLLLLARVVRIRLLLHKLEGCVSFPRSQAWDRWTPPAYLSSLSLRLSALCSDPRLRRGTGKAIAAIINAKI